MSNQYKDFSPQWAAYEKQAARSGIQTNTSLNADTFASYHTSSGASYPSGAHQSFSSGQSYGAYGSGSTSSGQGGIISFVSDIFGIAFALVFAAVVFVMVGNYTDSAGWSIGAAFASMFIAADIVRTKSAQSIFRTLAHIVVWSGVIFVVGWFFLQ